MITVPELAAEALGSFLSTHLNRRFWSTQAHLTEIIPSVARLALECIGNSDALYHNVEHTMLVTLVGYDIMKGRALLTPTTPDDFAHLLVACLLHDIGYVRGILKGQRPTWLIRCGAFAISCRPVENFRNESYFDQRVFGCRQNCPRHRIHALSHIHRWAG